MECLTRLILLFVGLLQDRLDHFIPDPDGFGKAWCKIGLCFLEAVSIAFKVAETDALAPALQHGYWREFPELKKLRGAKEMCMRNRDGILPRKQL